MQANSISLLVVDDEPAMRRVLHHPDSQATESLWRSIDLIVRRLETGANLQVVLYDMTAEEIAAAFVKAAG